MNKEAFINHLKDLGATMIFGGTNQPIAIIFRSYKDISESRAICHEEVKLFDWYRSNSESHLGHNGFHEAIMAYEIKNEKRPSAVLINTKTLYELMEKDIDIRYGFCYNTNSINGIKILRSIDLEENKFICF